MMKRWDGSLARLSMQRKLPLVIGVLLLGAVVVVSAAAYVEVRRTSMESATARLASVSSQLRDMLQQSAVQLGALATATAARPEVQAFARTRDPKLASSVTRALRTDATPAQRQQSVVSELRDSADHVLATTSPEWSAVLSGRELVRDDRADGPARVSPFRLVRDTIVYAVAAPVVPGTGGVHVVHWRRLAGSRRAREQIERLVGSGATIFVGGNGGIWTDLERAVSSPPVRGGASGALQQYRRDGASYLAASAPVAGTPWSVVVDFPGAVIVAPAEAFLRRMAIIALATIFVGLLATWLVSRHVIRERDEALRRLGDAQDAFVRREKLAILGQLSSGVGHELRNPLGVMTNAVYYLRMVQPDAPPAIREYLDILQQQIGLSEKIVGDLLDFARSKPPQRKPTSVASVTREQVERLGGLRGSRVETDSLDALPRVLVDPTQLGQIMMNLLTNAAQAIDGAGTIRVLASVIGDTIVVDVVDSGPGIAADAMEKIFEPLFTTKARGIGLGLAVSRMLARANGGDLTAGNVPSGRGAVFHLRLPLAPPGEEVRTTRGVAA